MEGRFTEQATHLSEDSVDQMLVLAERLREANGGQLDDSAIQAVAEATGAPAEYVRLAVKLRTEQQKQSFLANVRSQYLALEPHTRRFVLTGMAATMCGLFSAAASKAALLLQGNENLASPGSIFGMIALVWLTLGLYNACVSRDSKTAAMVGAIFGGSFFATNSIFGFVFQIPASHQPPALLLVPCTLLGAVIGLGVQRVTDRNRSQLGLKDPIRERQELLKQLVDLRDKLQSSEQTSTFLSVDIVGSTRMKELADPLAIEFTFNEYHQYVERIVKQYRGEIHSTAGDGVTCAFDHPQQAFNAARNIQAGLIELNTFRNKIGVPITIRQGIHTGTIMTAEVGDIRSVNFSHVIDIAAHLQKFAPTGGIVVSDAAALYLPGGAGSVGTEKVTASGVSGTVWQTRPIQNEVTAGGPPPLPGQV